MVAGVVFLADADPHRAALGGRLKDAVAAVRLPFIIKMGELFPDLSKGGSLDDVGNVAAAIHVVLDEVNQNLCICIGG